MVPETRVFQAADGEDLVILVCTVFDWSTRVTDGQTDRQMDRIAMAKTRRAESIAAFMCKNWCTGCWRTFIDEQTSRNSNYPCIVVTFAGVQKEIAKRHADMRRSMPDSCWSGSKTFWSFLTSWMWTKNSECVRLFESMEIDPLWEVPPTKVSDGIAF